MSVVLVILGLGVLWVLARSLWFRSPQNQNQSRDLLYEGEMERSRRENQNELDRREDDQRLREDDQRRNYYNPDYNGGNSWY